MDILELILGVFPIIKAILLAVIPLGFLIFIHELGHFLAAKKVGIKVNTFSIGFGPKIVGYKHGDTEYRLSVLPFGGYVQMEGENPNEQTGAEGEFASASLGKRAFVVIAGPAVNLLFGVLVYWFVFSVGINADAIKLINGLTGQTIGLEDKGVQIGMIADDGPGAIGGVMPNDTVVSIDGEPAINWIRFTEVITLNPEKELELVVERDGTQKTLTVVPEAVEASRGKAGKLYVSLKSDSVVTEIDPESPASQAGIKLGDYIDTIDGQKIYNTPYFGPEIWGDNFGWIGKKHQSIYNKIEQNRDALVLGIIRGDEKFTVQIPVQWNMKVVVQENSTAFKAGIRSEDILVTFNGKTVDSKSLYSEIIASANQTVTLGIIRDGERRTVTLSPTKKSKHDHESTYYGLRWYNFLSGMLLTEPEIPTQYYTFFGAITNGLNTHWLTCTSIARILKKLFVGEVSAKHLSGPFGIGEMTNRMFKSVGLNTVLFFIGFISINLAIVNLLPIPIADGGHLLFFALEKIRGRPVSQKAQAVIQQVSIVLILALFLYITWYDLRSLFDGLRN